MIYCKHVIKAGRWLRNHLSFLSEVLVHKSLQCKGRRCVQLQGYNLAGIVDLWWDRMWLRQAGIAGRGKPFCVSEQWECREPCLKVGKELVRIRGWTSGGDIMVEKGERNPTWSLVW